jgi:hypothetical protein
LAHRATSAPKRKVPELVCGQEDKICAGQRLTAFASAWRSGSPFQRRTPRPAGSSRKTLPFRFEATNGFRCRRLKWTATASNDIYLWNFSQVELIFYGVETTKRKD